ncbi:hypothetical protein NEMIN01_2523, partial [Nematocida minor]|uniref:uncharacterized protein n=1 Tax=Nematocida minor TaxID=1912983 RepID=UPI00221E71F7
IENEMNCKGDVTHQMMEYAYISAYNLVCRIFASLSKYSQNNYLKTAEQSLREKKQMHLDRIKMNEELISDITNGWVEPEIRQLFKDNINEKVQLYAMRMPKVKVERSSTEKDQEESILLPARKTSKKVNFVLLMVLITIIFMLIYSSIFILKSRHFRKA